MDADARTLAIVSLIATVPICIVFIFALLRGYEIKIHFIRKPRRQSDDNGEG